MHSLPHILSKIPFFQDIMRDSAENKANVCCESSGCSLNFIALIACVAVTVIGCLAIAGVMGGSNLGWITIGVGGGTVVFGAISTCFTRQKIGLIGTLSIYFIVMGTLGGLGIISSVNLGWAIIAPALLAVGCGISVSCYGGSSATSGLIKTKVAKERIVKYLYNDTGSNAAPHKSDGFAPLGDT